MVREIWHQFVGLLAEFAYQVVIRFPPYYTDLVSIRILYRFFGMSEETIFFRSVFLAIVGAVVLRLSGAQGDVLAGVALGCFVLLYGLFSVELRSKRRFLFAQRKEVEAGLAKADDEDHARHLVLTYGESCLGYDLERDALFHPFFERVLVYASHLSESERSELFTVYPLLFDYLSDDALWEKAVVEERQIPHEDFDAGGPAR